MLRSANPALRLASLGDSPIPLSKPVLLGNYLESDAMWFGIPTPTAMLWICLRLDSLQSCRGCPSSYYRPRLVYRLLRLPDSAQGRDETNSSSPRRETGMNPYAYGYGDGCPPRCGLLKNDSPRREILREVLNNFLLE